VRLVVGPVVSPAITRRAISSTRSMRLGGSSCRSRVCATIASVLATTVVVASCAASGGASNAPPPLSTDRSSPSIASTYGSGVFGTWQVDRFGLPTYRYTMDEQTDPRARQPELAGSTDAWSQVGNDHFVANAYNHGYVQLWSQDRTAQWMNHYDAANRHYSGGYGYLDVNGKVVSTLYDDRPAGATTDRRFGVGYFGRRMQTGGVDVNDAVYAPFGNDPVLVHDVTIANTTNHLEHVSWFEYWDVNPYLQALGKQRGLASPSWQSATQTLSVAQRPDAGDTQPLTIFAAQVRGSTKSYETTQGAFFGSGTRARPQAVAQGRLSDRLAGPVPNGVEGTTLFALHTTTVLAPGHSTTLRYLYGYGHPSQIPALVAKYRHARDPFGASEQAWHAALPQASLGTGQPWLGRELMWDAYLLRSASVYEEVCGAHTITQGGYYQYNLGLNLGYRSWLHYLLPITSMDPQLAREILVYSTQLQPQGNNQLPYGTTDLCNPVNLGTSDDLDFWLLLAAAQYGLTTRDVGFFDRTVRFYGSDQATSVWQHLKLAFAHQQSLLGPHGEFLALSTGDWSDFSPTYMGMTESTLVVAQSAYAYPQLAALADLRGDHSFAAQLRAAAASLLTTLRGQWTGLGWYSRGYSGSRQLGQGAIWLEPQPWAILSGAPSHDQIATLVANLRRFLDGVGAPAVIHGPDRIGTSLSPARNDPAITEQDTPEVGIGDNNAVWPGGTWFDPDGWLTWAYASLDGTLPQARQLAFDEYERTTLANHAAVFPDHWNGITSVDDTCSSFFSSAPSRCGGALAITTYEGQITEQPTWMAMGALNLAGITPTATGYRIEPHFPFKNFSLRFPEIGLAGRAGLLRGYVRPVAGGRLRMQVAVPAGATHVVAWVAGSRARTTMVGDAATFNLPTTAGHAADWAISWQTPR
jgi:Glycosyl hydrolase 36 superfamily, catalytic domain/Glycosyltransferase family 36